MLIAERKFFKPKKPARVLTILEAIENNPRVSQSALARQAGVSVAMINSYIKDLQQRDLIFMTGKNRRNTRYFLTDKGRMMSSGMLRNYSTEVIQLYGAAKQSMCTKLERFIKEGIHRIALFGAAETAEVVLAAAERLPIEIVAAVDNDPARQGAHIGGLTIGRPEDLTRIDVDAVIVSSFAQQDAIVDEITHLEERGIKIRTL